MPGEMREWKWSPAEKAIARRAYDRALGRELESVIQETKERASRIREVSEVWELEDWLVQRRRRIDRTFDYRYSVLPLVFGALVREGRLSEYDLEGLGPEKMEAIQQIVRADR
ncbi:MAG: hypothetical protein WBW84_16245 [Acidobacteriaceae bacterium]